MDSKRRVGIVGFGRLGIFITHTRAWNQCLVCHEVEQIYLALTGRYLYEVLVTEYSDDYEVVFVWNRSPDKMQGVVPQHLVLLDLSDAASTSPDLIVEVAHPSIIADCGKPFLQIADFMASQTTCNFSLAYFVLSYNIISQ